LNLHHRGTEITEKNQRISVSSVSLWFKFLL